MTGSYAGSYSIRRDLAVNDSVYNNYILRDIAYGSKVQISSITINIDYQVNYTYRNDPRVLEVFVSPVLARPLKYKHFDISGVLAPSALELKLVLQDSLGIDLIHLLVYMDDQPLRKEYNLRDILPGSVDTVVTGDVTWFFTEEDYSHFTEALLRINNYYAAVDLMKRIEKEMIREEHSEELDMIEDYLHRFEWQRVLDYIDEYDFVSGLNLKSNDPGNFQDLRNRLERLNTRHRTLFLENASWSDGSEQVSAGRGGNYYLNLIDDYYNLKLETDHQFALFYDRLIRTSMRPDQLRREEGLMGKVTGGKDVYRYFLNEFYLAMINKGKEYLAENDHEKALTYFFKAYELSVAAPEMITVDRQLDELISNARKGVHDSYFYIVRKSLEKGNVSMASTYLDEAVKVSSALWNQISFTTLFSLRNEIIASYLKACDTLVENDPDETMKMVRELQRFCDQYNIHCPEAIHYYEDLAGQVMTGKKLKKARDLIGNDKLAEADLLMNDIHPVTEEQHEDLEELHFRLAEKNFKIFMERAEKFRELDDHELALRYYSLCQYLQNKYPSLDGDAAKEGIREMARPLLISNIDKIKNQIIVLDFEHATVALDDTRELQHQYQLVTDSSINASIVDAEFLLNRYRCDFEQVRFTERYDSAVAFLAERRFEDVIHVISRAMDSEYVRKCRIGTEDAEGLSELARRSLEYLQMKSEIAGLMNNPEEFVLAFSQLKEHYISHHLENAGLEMILMEDYMCRTGDPECFRLVINYYRGQSQMEKAIGILSLAKDQGFQSKIFRNEQEEIGASVAASRFRDADRLSPYIVINNLTQNDPWFEYFRTSYLQTWQDLNEQDGN